MTLTIAIALILHPTDGTILIARRKAEAHLGGLWEFPGGKSEPGETPEACALRETWEETGLDVTILEAWPTIGHAYPDRTVVLHPFLCQGQSANAEPRESREVVWVQPGDLAHYPFPDANAPLLERLRERVQEIHAALPGNGRGAAHPQ